MWAPIVQLKFSRDDKMFYKYDYREEYRECVFREEIKTTRKKKNPGKKVKKQPKGISALKKKDLLKLIDKDFIKAQHCGYYESLLVNKGIRMEDDTVDV